MDFEFFHFAQPLWLWGLLVIPIIWGAFFLFYRSAHSSKQLEKMVDSHLLPFLLLNGKTAASWKPKLFIYSALWLFLMLALAGPRWSFRDIEMLSKNQSIVVLLDLSESMNATDVKPSRLVRAKQKIEDLMQRSQGVKIGLIAFAADPHMITPLTEDKETVRHLLPSLNTDLVYIQGSRLAPALKMASQMLEAEKGEHQAVVIISDGGIEDSSAIADIKKLAQQGIAVHTIGVGTVEGAPVQDSKGSLIKKNGQPIQSKLARALLQEISKAGGGVYIESYYSRDDEAVILERLQSNSEAVEAGKKMRLWDEKFVFFLVAALPFFLWCFRRGVLLSVFLLPFSLQASVSQHYFMNSEEKGAEAFERNSYEEAATHFEDSYRKGVASYKAGQFAEAEKLFRQSEREEVACAAGYNLGNALAQQHKFQEAMTAYEEVLKKWPEHQNAKENLELLKQMMEQQQQQQKEKQNEEQNQEKQNEQNNDQQQEKQDNPQENEESKQSEKQENNSSDQEPVSQEQEPQQEDEQPSSQEESSGSKEETSPEPSNSEEKEELEEKGDQPQAEKGAERKEEDVDADMWLNRLTNDQKEFLKNKFYIESKKNGTQRGIDPW